MINSNDEYKQKLLNNHSNKTGLRWKINANCIDCVYDPIDSGSWRQQVEDCKHVICLIYKHRPTSKGAKIMCIEIMYSVKTLFVSSEILNAEALQKSEEIELCEI